MRTANFTLGLATGLGLTALAVTPGLAQELYVRSAEPVGPGVVVVEEPGYLGAGERVIVREAPAPVIVEDAPERVIVTEPADGPFAREVYVRRTPLPPEPVPHGFYDGGCQTVERQSRSGIVTVGTVCD